VSTLFIEQNVSLLSEYWATHARYGFVVAVIPLAVETLTEAVIVAKLARVALVNDQSEEVVIVGLVRIRIPCFHAFPLLDLLCVNSVHMGAHVLVKLETFGVLDDFAVLTA